ncbi:hypothetical protein OKW41_002999 [Paraburkholderia sp. UCT70]|uniref:hypothetical protein n=1 Tax=Paraburkholderia sp. UCT70 TaxID=2991068 RepID=UPI003D1D5A96
MTIITRSTLMFGLICACCVAGTGKAEPNDRLLKLLQLQTLNRMASDAAPKKSNASGGDSARQDRGADRRGSQPQPDDRGAPGSVPARKP